MLVHSEKSQKQNFYESEDFKKILADLDPETFINDPDPMLAIECLLEARRNNIAVPEACLRWLALHLQTWYDAQGEPSLDELLGLSLGHGKRSPFQEDIRHERDKQMSTEIGMLKLLGVGLEDAAEMVRKKVAARPHLESGSLISRAAILRNYRVYPERAELERSIISIRDTLSPEGWLIFFDSFPSDSFSARVRERHAQVKELVSQSKSPLIDQ
jgi:hypothetical protein